MSTFGAGVMSRALAMLQSVAVARLVDPYRLGLFAIVSYVMGLVGAVCDLGLPVAITKLTAEYRATRPGAVLAVVGRLLRVMLPVTFGVTTALFLGAGRLATLYREPSLAVLFRLAAVSLVFAILGALRSAVLQGFQEIHLLAGLGVLQGATMLAFTLVLLPWLDLPGIILAAIFTEATMWIWSGRPLWRTVARDRTEEWPTSDGSARGALFGRAFHVAAPTLLNGLILFGSAWLVRSYLAYWRGYEAVGLYQIADSISRVLLLFSGSIALPLLPAVATAAAREASGLGARLGPILRGTLLVTLPVGIFLALGGRHLLTLVFGHSYSGAGAITSWLALATVFQALASVLWSVQVGTGRIWRALALVAAGQTVQVVGTLALTPGWGLIGLGASVTAGQAVSFGLAARQLSSTLGGRLEGFWALIPVAVVGWACVPVTFWLGSEGLAAAALITAGLVFVEALLLHPSERRLVREMTGWVSSIGVRRA